MTRIKKSLAAADTQIPGEEDPTSRLPEGEDLLLDMRIGKRIPVDGTILGRASNKQVIISLRDFVAALELPIDINMENKTAQGWYIREKRRFELDGNKRIVTADGKTFPFSENVLVEEDDVLIPIKEVAEWFGFNLTLNVAALDIQLDSPTPLPIQERLERGKYKSRDSRIGPPVLPLQEDERRNIDYPFIDVSTRASYIRSGNTGDTQNQLTTSIRTSGDFAQGTLTTQSSLSKDDKLDNLRLSYKRESLSPELLGPLKARKMEVGDVHATPLPLKNYSGSGLGARVTNAHPLRSTLRPSTEISGNTFPGWEAELYRDNQLLGYQTVDDSGEYRFENIDLYTSDNNFRVVLYGPQGEIREEEINVPVDPTRLSDSGGAYDVTVALQDTQTYRKRSIEDEDKGAPAISAMYEMPVGNQSALSAGLETFEDGGERKFVAHTGASTTLAGTLVNLDGAVDEKGETAAQLVARREIRQHQIRNEIKVASSGFNFKKPDKSVLATGSFLNDPYDDGDTKVFEQRLSLNGPLPLDLGLRPRYNLSFGYNQEADGDSGLDYTAGVSASLAGVSFNQQFNYAENSYGGAERLRSLTTASGSVGRTRLRMNADYQIKPESGLDRVSANARRDLTKDVELDLTLARKMREKVTEGRAQVNWDAGVANISPGLTYNTENDLAATVNVRFALAHDPQKGKFRAFERSISSNGSVSAFVFLDKNGNKEFDEEDEALPDVVIKAPQNGGRVTTDEKGYAFFTGMAILRQTDVFVDPDSLQDPAWIPGFKGVSVIPREGHVTTLNFPVHMGGEIDGNVYVRDIDGATFTQRGIIISLYDDGGNKILSSMSSSDGFYIFEKIPPGKYMMAVDGKSFKNKYARPQPQPVEIGYDGTILYGKNIYLEKDSADVPVNYIAAADYADAGHTMTEGRNVFINLGEFHSQLSMGLTWFQVKTLLKEASLLNKPSKITPDEKTGKYALRLTPHKNSLEAAYDICKNISARGYECSVDVVVKSDMPSSKLPPTTVAQASY